MKPLLLFLRTKLFLLSFLLTSTLIIATTITLEIKPNSKEEVAKTGSVKKEKRKTANKTGVLKKLSYVQVATVETDKPDYYPGDYVKITGSGWDAGEEVILNIVSDCGCTNVNYTVFADPDGNIFHDDFEIQEWHL